MDCHLLMVSKMVDVLSHDARDDDPNDEYMEESASDDSGSFQEAEDDFILCQYKKDIKLESLARRKPSKSGTKSKKR